MNDLNSTHNQIPGAFKCAQAHPNAGLCKPCLNKLLAHRGVGAKCPMCRADFKTNVDARVLLEDVRVLQRVATGLLFRLVKAFGPAVDTNRNLQSYEKKLVRRYEELERHEAAVYERKNVSFAPQLKAIVADLTSIESVVETAEQSVSVLNARAATTYMLQRYPEIPFTMTRESKAKVNGIRNRY